MIFLKKKFVRVVAGYLVHYGYCSTIESFAKSTGQSIGEEVISIRNRQSWYLLHSFTNLQSFYLNSIYKQVAFFLCLFSCAIIFVLFVAI